MKKKKVYVNKIDKKVGNNQSSCEVQNEERTILVDSKLNVLEKLDKLFNTNGYIFNVDVDIVTTDKKYHTKIASKVGNSLITLDNDIINISDIKDINY